jgi:hypothetical protein
VPGAFSGKPAHPAAAGLALPARAVDERAVATMMLRDALFASAELRNVGLPLGVRLARK